jgi:hypothetical protein
MKTDVQEVADGIYRLSTYVEPADFTFNQYLIAAEQPLLFHTGTRGLFPLVSAVALMHGPAVHGDGAAALRALAEGYDARLHAAIRA